MKTQIKSTVFILLTLLTIRSFADGSFDTIKFVSEKQESLKQIIKKNDIEGLSIAFFTNDKVIWKKCFGKSNYKQAINDSTLFSIQSMSKNFTALAIMHAVQEGLVDLDTPIKKYLTDFRINSCYEESPEEKITLRMILNHTAGFTHEAPSGNNFDFRCPSKQDHWNSIRNTWLKYPVGSKYSYSNLGFDLAAEIIEKVSGMSFETYVRKKIFEPLGMKYSTIDDNDLVSNRNKTDGRIDFFVKQKHYKIPLIGSGAVYSNIRDMIRYVQFQMNFGKINGQQVIGWQYFFEMYTINKSNYGLGTYIGHSIDKEKQFDTYFLNHNGGGFGYGSSMTWFPEYGLGCVILGNKPFDYGSITNSILVEFITKNSNVQKDTSLTAGFFPLFKSKEPDNSGAEFINYYEGSKNKMGKSNVIGKYEVLFNGMEFKWFVKILRFFGFKYMTMSIVINQNTLLMKGCFGEKELKEYLPGLYFTADGEAFDYRNETPSFRNIKLRKY
ncbi:MAG: serine hydrolase [Bacteroidia bacterium]|nr:serine hydrolase [Bacteroidia bacterium]